MVENRVIHDGLGGSDCLCSLFEDRVGSRAMAAPEKRYRPSVFDQITGGKQGMAVDFVVFLQQMALGVEPADARLSALG